VALGGGCCNLKNLAERVKWEFDHTLHSRIDCRIYDFKQQGEGKQRDGTGQADASVGIGVDNLHMEFNN